MYNRKIDSKMANMHMTEREDTAAAPEGANSVTTTKK